MENNKGFAVSGIFYTVLIIFLVLITALLLDLQNKKTLLDKMRSEAVGAVSCDDNYEYIMSELNKLKQQVNNNSNYYTKEEIDDMISEINNKYNYLNDSVTSITTTQNDILSLLKNKQ